MLGFGIGTVVGPGFDCGFDCDETVVRGSSFFLTAVPESGSRFESWTNCTKTSGTLCHVEASADKTITAVFRFGTATPTAPPPTLPPPTPPPSGSTVTVFARVLTGGDSGEDVRALQNSLRTLGFLPSSHAPTLYFGPITEGALKGFQSSVGLSQTGVFDGATRTLLTQALSQRSSVGTTPPPSSGAIRFVWIRDLQFGDTGEDVRVLQIFLNRIGYSLAASGPGSAGLETTYFGVATEQALIRFQEAYANEILNPSGFTRGTGYFGPSSRSKAESIGAAL